MKIDSHWYSLRPAGRLNSKTAAPRFGSLLRVTFGEGMVGYADIHPWPEWSEAPLHNQLNSLKTSTPLPLAAKSLEIALLDAEARFVGRSLFADLLLPRNHLLITDITTAQHNTSDIVKIKIGPEDFSRDKSWLELGKKIRLDFNSSLSASEFLNSLEQFSEEELAKIDFIEDPCVFDEQVWTAASERVQLAADREQPTPLLFPKLVAVLKPTAEQNMPAEEFKRVVYTHKMDHPLGVAYATYVAAVAETSEFCGLSDAGIYQPHEFSNWQVGAGTGLGFDELLKGLVWTKLKE